MILLLTTNLARGGAETQVAQLAIGLAARGWDVSVASMLPPSAFQEELAAAGVRVFPLGMKPGVPNPVGLVRLAALLRELRPAVLHCHMFHANLLGRLARLIAPVPTVVSTAHSIVESSRASESARGRELLYRITDWLADTTVCVCEAGAKRYAGTHAAPRRKLKVIPNGVDTARFRPDSEMRAQTRKRLAIGDEFVWLAAGRLMWKKDYPTMLRAFTALQNGLLLIAGEGPQELESGANVRLLGPRHDIPELMNAADACVLSSVVEGLPMALLEAASSALPCVATDVGGVAEIVRDPACLVPPGDAAALQKAMLRVMELPPEQRRAMGQANREHAVARFDMNAVIGQWERLYDQLARASC